MKYNPHNSLSNNIDQSVCKLLEANHAPSSPDAPTTHSFYLLGIHVEFLSPHGHLFIPLHVFPGAEKQDRSEKKKNLSTENASIMNNFSITHTKHFHNN